MIRTLHIIFLTVVAICVCCQEGVAQSHRVSGLRVEGVKSPIGVNTLAPRFSWIMESDTRNARQTAYEIEVEQNGKSIWNSGKVYSEETLWIPYGGMALSPATTYSWRVRIWNECDKESLWSQYADFTTALVDSNWADAKWIQMEETGRIVVPGLHLNSEAKKTLGDEKTGMYRLPQFRKVSKIEKPVCKAILAVSGLGQFEMTINGQKVGHNFLDPGWTAFDKEILYVMEDVTHMIKPGDNVLGAMLGGGFYNIPRERYFKLLATYGAPRLKVRLMIDYEDGSHEDIVTDNTWSVSPSPITYSSIYGGEDFDATLIQEGWNYDPDFDDSHWQEPIVMNDETPMRAQVGCRMAVKGNYAPLRHYKNSRGNWVYDFGQNMSGIIDIKVTGDRGQSLRLIPAELLNADSTANQRATGSPFYYRYTAGGTVNDDGIKTTEQWQPRFTYYGFRYVEVEGALPAGADNPDSLPEICHIEALHTTTECQSVGRFVCSKLLFNQIYSLIDWASRSNMASLTTDCPTREKLGWQEQNNLMQSSLQYCYDLNPFFVKIIGDMAQAQHDDGAIPTICPEYTRFADGFEDSPEWGASFIICPWNLYKWYGDKSAIEANYDGMVRYLDYLLGRTDNLILSYGLGDWFDIGPNRPGKSQLTSLGVTSTAYLQYEAKLMSKMASLIGKAEDAYKYATLAGDIGRAFVDKYFNSQDSIFDKDSQTTNAMVASLDIAGNEILSEKAIDRLVYDIRNRDNALTAGDIGYRYVLLALAKGGFSDVIYDMNSRYDTYGYGWQLAHGATALTESWQALRSVSNNHMMLGHLMEWFYAYLGGIRQADDDVSWKNIIIAPQPVGDIYEIDTEFDSPRGAIRCHWSRLPSGSKMQVVIPANTSAHVTLPGTENTILIGSGSYIFEY